MGKIVLRILAVVVLVAALGLVARIAMHPGKDRPDSGFAPLVIEGGTKTEAPRVARPLVRPQDWVKGSEPKDCEDADQRVGILIPHARMCETDDECRHYPCTCHAIGSREAAIELLGLEEWLDKKCKGSSLVPEYCGETKPICVDHLCVVQKLGEPRPEVIGPGR